MDMKTAGEKPIEPKTLTNIRRRQNRTIGVYYPFSELENFVSNDIGGGFQSDSLSTDSSVIHGNPPLSPILSQDVNVHNGGSSYAISAKKPSSPQSVLEEIKAHENKPVNDEETGMNKDDSVSLANHRSKREKKIKKITRDKKRAHYDMNLVPKVAKNKQFLNYWRQESSTVNKICKDDSSCSSSSLPCLVSCDSLDMAPSQTVVKKSKSEFTPHEIHNNNIGTFQEKGIISTSEPIHMLPFSDDESVIWVPKTRSEWEDCIDELTAVCTSAAWHKHQETKSSKDFHPPLSDVYIRDRIDIDDPLRGYQIRHKNGWLQGFVMMTTFTTWTHYFKWDSNHPKNGLKSNEHEIGQYDHGSLSNELEMQPRSGNPLTDGVVWSTIAEIGLVGALGCGEYLLQMALEDITRRGDFEYVVLQATDSSRPFYEKFGFVRVGAVSKYGSEQEIFHEAEIVGYRHWTYANETSQRLDQHGDPSCMMALKLKTHTKKLISSEYSFLDEMSRYFVLEKPKILPMGRPSKRKTTNCLTTTSNGKGKGSKSARPRGRPRKLNMSTRKRTLSDVSYPVQGLSEHTTETNQHNIHTNDYTLPPGQQQGVITPTKKVKSNGKPCLRKQKFSSIYRDPNVKYFYNKVVTPLVEYHDNCEYVSKYYFVLNYEDNIKMIRIIPLFQRGTFKGKREGRTKWKASVIPRNEGLSDSDYYQSIGVKYEPCSQWDIVPSQMVTKCCSVVEESWDIL